MYLLTGKKKICGSPAIPQRRCALLHLNARAEKGAAVGQLLGLGTLGQSVLGKGHQGLFKVGIRALNVACFTRSAAFDQPRNGDAVCRGNGEQGLKPRQAGAL